MGCDLNKNAVILLGQEGYTKFPYFLSEWEQQSRGKSLELQNGPKKILSIKNIVNLSLIESQKNVLLPRLHIKFEIMKQSVKTLIKTDPHYQYIVEKYTV